MKKFLFLIPYLLIAFVYWSGGCTRQPTGTADVPRLVSQSHRISVAPFSQPLVASQLFTGQIPIPQGKIPAGELKTLDRDLREVLYSTTKRQFDFLSSPPSPVSGVLGSQPQALDYWLTYGEEHNLDYILVPQVLDWNERQGSEAGVSSSASVRLEFFLISIPQKVLLSRSIYEEKQVGLIDNILTVGEFIKRKGQWVTANTLAREGMLQAIKDMGL